MEGGGWRATAFWVSFAFLFREESGKRFTRLPVSLYIREGERKESVLVGQLPTYTTYLDADLGTNSGSVNTNRS